MVKRLANLQYYSMEFLFSLNAKAVRLHTGSTDVFYAKTIYKRSGMQPNFGCIPLLLSDRHPL